jgi:hypothetical protein
MAAIDPRDPSVERQIMAIDALARDGERSRSDGQGDRVARHTVVVLLDTLCVSPRYMSAFPREQKPVRGVGGCLPCIHYTAILQADVPDDGWTDGATSRAGGRFASLAPSFESTCLGGRAGGFGADDGWLAL